MPADTPAAWTPDADTVAASHIARLMAGRGFTGYDQLHRWSVDHRDDFWSLVLDELDIVFEAPPTAIRGSDDPRHPDWLPGARFNIVESCLDGPGEAAAVITRSGERMDTTTVAQLRRTVASFVAGFAASGYQPGDRIAIAMPMTLEAVVAYLGIIAAGGVVVSIADSFAPDEIAVRLSLTDPVAVITQDVSHRLGRSLPMYAKVRDVTGVRCIVVETGADVPLGEGDTAWTDFLVEAVPGDGLVTVPGPGERPTNILFSSGTTGEPKVIPWTQTTPIKAAMDGRFHQDIHEGDVVAWPTNLGWMMGPWLIYASLLNDAAIALFDDAPTTRAFVEFVEDAGVTMLGLVPSIASSWRSAGTLDRGDWSSVRVISSTGEASVASDYRWLTEAAGGVPIIEYCGGTELGGGYIASTVVHPSIPSRFATPALGMDLILLDDEGREADVGEVYLVPPSIGMSDELLNRDHDAVYFSQVPEGHGPLRRHGDQMMREPDGTYRALGRVDDTMNLGGIKVSSAEIEEVVGTVEGVGDVAAVAVPPADGGPDRLVMFVVPSIGSIDTAAMREVMQRAISEHLNPLFRVHDVVVVESLPRTASHKVMRRTLRAGYRA